MQSLIKNTHQIKKIIDQLGLRSIRSWLIAGVWLTVNRYRLLFSYRNSDLGISEKMKCILARTTIAFCEICMNALPLLDTLIKRPPPPSSDLAQLTCMMVIGSLGAGGAEKQLVTLVRELHRQKTFKRVVVACLSLSTAAANFYRPSLEAIGVDILDMERNFGKPLTKHCQSMVEHFPPWARERMAAYMHVIDQVRPDILQLWMDECNVIGGMSGLCWGVPAILMSARSQAPYHFSFHQPWMRAAYRAILRQSGVTLYANSEHGAQDYAQWLNLPREAVSHVYNGFEMTRCIEDTPEHLQVIERLAADRQHKTLKLIAVGRLSEEKQPFYLIAMFREILRLDPSAHLLWVGDGVMAQEVEQALNRLPIGHVTRVRQSRNVTALITSSDAVILTSRIEGLPNVLVEAQSLGKPVFTTSAGGAIEAFINGVSGAMLPARAPKEAGQLLVSLMREGKISSQAAKKAPDFIAETFDARVMAQKTIQLYKSLTTTSRPEKSELGTNERNS
jgi:glycosyltransferase involved in cell wall biosynthesis